MYDDASEDQSLVNSADFSLQDIIEHDINDI